MKTEKPIRTHDKTLRQVEINGVPRWVEETIVTDYGRQGKTTVYILATEGGADEDAENRRNLDHVLARVGYRLKKTGDL